MLICSSYFALQSPYEYLANVAEEIVDDERWSSYELICFNCLLFWKKSPP